MDREIVVKNLGKTTRRQEETIVVTEQIESALTTRSDGMPTSASSFLMGVEWSL